MDIDAVHRDAIIGAALPAPAHELNCPPLMSYGGLTETMPEIDISIVDLDILVFENAEETWSCKMDKAASVAHDYTFAFMGDNFDVPLSTIQMCGDRSDNSTPDMIIKYDENTFVVIEFTTEYVNSVEALQRAAANKRNKYYQELRRRAGPVSISYYIIAVTKFYVLTNLELAQSTATYLCSRYRKSLDIRSLIISKGGINLLDPTLSSTLRKVEATFNYIDSVPLSFDGYEIFTEELWANKDFKSTPEQRAPVFDAIKTNLEKAFSLCVPKTKAEVLTEAEEQWADLTSQNAGGRMDQKSIINLPFWVVKNDGSGNSLPAFLPHPHPASLDPAHNLLAKVISHYTASPELMTDDVLDELSIAREHMPVPPKHCKHAYRRVDPKLTESEKEELAQTGWGAKRRKKAKIVQQYREEKKSKFSYAVDTSDLDDFLESAATLFEPCENPKMAYDSVMLLKSTKDIHSKSVTWPYYRLVEPTVDSYLRSRMGIAMSLISDVASELCVSQRQRVDDNNLIFKKLRNRPVYIIAHPSEYNHPIAFMLAVQNKDIDWQLNAGSVFRKCNTDGIWTWTQVLTVNQSKLVNWLKAESMTLCNLAFALDYWSVEANPIIDIRADQRALQLATFLTIVLLHDKHTTEESISLSRYILLEGFKSRPETPQPQKHISKLSPYPKSRFEVWVNKRLYHECRRLISVGGYQRDGYCKLDCTKMVCPFTNHVLTNPQQLVNVFYYGYLCNKEEAPETNVLGNLLVKILEQEELLPRNSDGTLRTSGLGHEDVLVDELETHEFSLTFLDIVCEHALEKLKQSTGSNVREQIEHQISRDLSRELIVDLATLKASSAFGPELYKKNFDRYSRPRAVEQIYKMIGEDDYLLTDLLPNSLKQIEDAGGYLHCDIFKKPQHSGLREIYVLAAAARVVQKVVETMARTLCSYFPSETMTHPNSKYTIPESVSHDMKRENSATDKIVTTAVSDDAEKWSQRHIASKFFLMLCKFLPDRYHKFLFRALRMWEKKRMMLDTNLMNMFNNLLEKNLTLSSSEPIVTKIFRAYAGIEPQRWFPGGQNSTYLELKSGMMQGILHYTSSFLHTIFLEWFEDQALHFMVKMLEKRQCDARVYAFHLQSSDDSSMSISVVSPKINKRTLDRYLLMTAAIFRLKGLLSPWLGIYESSKKKKSNTCNFMEFNSEFYLGGNVYKPTVKFTAACLQILESESLVGRYEQMYNLITQIPENGGTFILASLCQFAQGLLHYRLLGSSLSPVFGEYSRVLCITKDPSCGYFLMDLPVAAGVGGVSYLIYKAAKASPVLQHKYQFVLKGFRAKPKHAMTAEELQVFKEQQQAAIYTMSSGLVTKGTSIPLGDRKKWSALIERMGLPTNWKALVEQDPGMLYHKPRSGLETKLKIAIMLHSPGVSETLSKTNALSRIMAAGVYMLSRPVMSKRSLFFNDDDGTVDFEHDKHSLLYWTEHPYEGAALEDEDWCILFPNQGDYDSLDDRLTAFTDLEGTLLPYTQQRRKIRSTIRIFGELGDSNVNYERIASDIWFGTTSSGMSRNMLRYAWDVLKGRFKWLQDDASATLKDSPFGDHIRLHNFLVSLIPKRRTLRLNGTPARSTGGVSNIISALTYDVWGNFYYTMRTDYVALSQASKYQQVKHALYMINNMPTAHGLAAAANVLREVVPQDPIGVEARSSKAALQILRSVAQGDSKEAVLSLIQSYKVGVIGYYRTAQQFDSASRRYTGWAVWVGSFHGVGVVAHFGSQGEWNVLVQIEINQRLDFKERTLFLEDLAHWAEQEHVTYDWSLQHPTLLMLDRAPSAGVKLYNVAPGCNAASIMAGARGPEVRLVEDMEVTLDPVYFSAFAFDLTGYSVRVRTSVPLPNNKQREVTVFSLRTRANDAAEQVDASLFNCIRGQTFVYYWVTKRPLLRYHAMQLFNTFAQSGDKKKENWLREQLLYHLSRHGLGVVWHPSIEAHPPIPVPARLMVPEDTPIPEFDYESAWNYINEVAADMAQIAWSDSEESAADSDTASHHSFGNGFTEEAILQSLQELEFTTAEFDQVQNNMPTHPMLSQLIQELVSNHRQQMVRLQVTQGEIPRGSASDDWVRVLVFALRIPETNLYEASAQTTTETADI